MRVVAGIAKGRLLSAPQGQVTRPTPVKVRQAVFNSLESLDGVAGAAIADLFAGTGALAIEGLSRGAASAVLCETDRAARTCIEKNLAQTAFSTIAKVSPLSAQAWLATALPGSVDLVIADPPYRFADWSELLELVAPVLTADGLLVAESDRELDITNQWEVVRCKHYGTTVVTILGVTASQDLHPDFAKGDQP